MMRFAILGSGQSRPARNAATKVRHAVGGTRRAGPLGCLLSRTDTRPGRLVATSTQLRRSRDQNDAARLDQLRTDIPAFDITREITRDRIWYLSRRRHAGVQPHAVVTADLDELWAALSSRPDSPSPRLTRPSQPELVICSTVWVGQTGQTDRWGNRP